MLLGDVLRGLRATQSSAAEEHPIVWNNTFTAQLSDFADSRISPADRVRAREVEAAFSLGVATEASAPQLVALSSGLLSELGKPFQEMVAGASESCQARWFVGNEPLPGAMEPWCSNYGGHQFGSWAGQLGDGRALTLGQLETPGGETWELQLKGAGPTPYSRFADGLAVVRSSVREYLCSEAMHYLGVPTTRVLSLCTTGDSVSRDRWNRGSFHDEPGAVVCRAARNFVRFGSFQLPYSRGNHELSKALAKFCVQSDPAWHEMLDGDEIDYEAWLTDVVQRNAQLVAQWQALGFVHGVLNTDNMSCLGLTIDYGPFAFLERFDPDFVACTTDESGRYRFKQQPAAVLWNCVQLARALSKLMETDAIQRAIDSFGDAFATEYESRMADKLGLPGGWRGADDGALLQRWLTLLAGGSNGGHDYTNCFRALCHVHPSAGVEAAMHRLHSALGRTTEEELGSWHSFFEAYFARVGALEEPEMSARRVKMLRTNPKYILRNYHAHAACSELEKSGDATKLHRLLEVLQRPFDEMPEAEAQGFAKPAPLEVARERGVTILS